MLKLKSTTISVKDNSEELKKAVMSIKEGPYVKAGILSETNQTLDDGITLAGIASVQEFGTNRAGPNNNTVIPQRSWLRSTMIEQRPLFTEATKKALLNIALGGDVFKELGKIGLTIEVQLKKKMGSNIPPPNAPSTIAAKGSSTTLINTGRTRAAISSKVVLPGEE